MLNRSTIQPYYHNQTKKVEYIPGNSIRKHNNNQNPRLGKLEKGIPSIVQRLPMLHEKGGIKHFTGNLGTYRDFVSYGYEQRKKAL